MFRLVIKCPSVLLEETIPVESCYSQYGRYAPFPLQMRLSALADSLDLT